jgi:hypothetical protein
MDGQPPANYSPTVRSVSLGHSEVQLSSALRVFPLANMASTSSADGKGFRRGLSVRLNRLRRKYQRPSDDWSTNSFQRNSDDLNE